MTYPTLIPCKNSQIIIIALIVINPKKVALGKKKREKRVLVIARTRANKISPCRSVIVFYL